MAVDQIGPAEDRSYELICYSYDTVVAAAAAAAAKLPGVIVFGLTVYIPHNCD